MVKRIQNSDCPAGRRGGRRPRPPRCVIQLRVRQDGKVQSYYSVTVPMPPNVAMKLLQQMFAGDRTYQRLSDDTRWELI